MLTAIVTPISCVEHFPLPFAALLLPKISELIWLCPFTRYKIERVSADETQLLSHLSAENHCAIILCSKLQNKLAPPICSTCCVAYAVVSMPLRKFATSSNFVESAQQPDHGLKILIYKTHCCHSRDFIILSTISLIFSVVLTTAYFVQNQSCPLDLIKNNNNVLFTLAVYSAFV